MRPLFGRRCAAARCDGPVYIGFDFNRRTSGSGSKNTCPRVCVPATKRMAALSPSQVVKCPFKSLKSDFEDLCKGLQKMGGEMLVPLIDLISPIKRYMGCTSLLKTVTLTEYLRQNGGGIDLARCQKIFMPS